MKAVFRAAASLSVMMVLSASAYATDQGGPQRDGHQGGPRAACREDAQTFCKGIQPGGGRILDCLKDHYKEISDSCYQALQNMPSHGGRQGHGNEPASGGPQGNNEESDR